jgi:lipopolysaccharide biosynthesis protein/glycosyltransferase involved in cell wall biosynthesis
MRLDFFSRAQRKRRLISDANLIKTSGLMDERWYFQTYPELKDVIEDAAQHYILNGALAFKNPGPNFDTEFYLSENPDVKPSKINPLVHYIKYGKSEGRTAAPKSPTWPVTNANIQIIKELSLSPELAIFVTYAPKGKIKKHVRYYIESLLKNEIAVALIVSTDSHFLDASDALIDRLSGVYIRSNEGYDFGAWAHLIKVHPALLDCKILYLLNDSIIGPLSEEAMGEVLAKIRESNASFIGLTDSFAIRWHVQSYFIAYKLGALSSSVFRKFWDDVVSYEDKLALIDAYEVTMARTLSDGGLQCEVLFPTDSRRAINRTCVEWRELISEGFPFLKVVTIRDEQVGVDIGDWQAVITACGFDTAIVEEAVRDAKSAGTLPGDRQAMTTGNSHRTSEELFWPEFYLAAYPDIAAAKLDPYYHYSNFGHKENRLAAAPGAGELQRLEAAKDSRETVLIVSHEGVRGGCPILSYNLIKELVGEYNVVALFFGPGPVLDACREIGAVVIGPVPFANAPRVADAIVGKIAEAAPIKFAVTNSIEARHALPALSKRYIPSISLIHEFTAYIRPKDAFREAVHWAGATVFSTEVTHDDAVHAYPDLGLREYLIIPQGRCVVPPDEDLRFSALASSAEASRVQELLRPSGSSEEAIIVIGAGNVEFRKGADIFIQCAAKVASLAPDLDIRFVWIGRGFDLATDVYYSVYLADQMRRLGVEDRVSFVGEVAALQVAYDMADLLLLTSRLDPLPNVAIDALEAGVPVVCFDKTTGIADVLKQNGLGDALVAPYLDVDEMARRIIPLAQSEDLRARVAAQASTLASAAFDMPAYVARLRQLGEDIAKQAKREKSDAEIIAREAPMRFDYNLVPEALRNDVEAVARDHVRSWVSGVGMRKLAPGFHPGVYLERHGVKRESVPLADYLREGSPEGHWQVPLITPNDSQHEAPPGMRVGLHIHVYYPALFPQMIARLDQNKTNPDLLISVTTKSSEDAVKRFIRDYKGKVTIRITPNRGRDIGPFLTEFGHELLNGYDIIGHLHTKKTVDVADAAVGQRWYRFLLENLLGGGAPMADIILSRMADSPDLGLVFPDDPHVIGWDGNRRFVEPYLEALSLDNLPKHLNFPVGTMFWARPQALKGLFDLRLQWCDYPAEPLPYDGSLLHGIERLFGVVAEQAGYKIANTNCPGVSR